MPLPIPSYSEIIGLFKKGATLEAQEKIMQLREAVLELQEENQELKKEIIELKKKLEVNKNLSFDGSVYRMKDTEEGPFCQVCYDTKHKLVRLQVNPLGHGLSEWYCKACEKSFEMK